MSTEKKLTAVEWLVENTPLCKNDFYLTQINQAKEMHKQQIVDAWIHAETRMPKEMKHINNPKNYYNETFKQK